MVGVEEGSSSNSWTWDQEKAFENALGVISEDCSNRWEMILAQVPGKTMEDIKEHYQLLVEDVNNIMSDVVPLPLYVSYPANYASAGGSGTATHGGRTTRSDPERRKGIPWTKEEQKLFLHGLEVYGRGDWRSISRKFVVTRTPTQVASHAQKFFKRTESKNKDRRRSSIHDITIVPNGNAPGLQGPTTGLVNGMRLPAPRNSTEQRMQLPIGPPGLSLHGTTIGQPIRQPVGTPLVSPMGMPGNLHVPAMPNMASGVGATAPMGGAVVPGAPMQHFVQPQEEEQNTGGEIFMNLCKMG